MEARYIRNVPALSEGECAMLRTKRAAVIGCGGLGGHLIELLARIGIGSLRCVDGDVFEESNLNRQLYARPSLLGTSKAWAAAARVSEINPNVCVEAVEAFLTEENALTLIADCDVVLDALDGIQARKILSKACTECNIPYVYGAISGWIAQAAVSMPGDGLIARLYPERVEIRDKSVLSFTPAYCAALQSALCVKLLLGRPVENGVLYFHDLLSGESETIPLL